MFKYETHCHCKEGSACASISAEEMVDLYKKQAYAGLIITNHFFNGNCSVDRTLAWEDKVDAYCKGYEIAKEYGDKIGMDVFFGIEYSYYGTDFLTYGVNKAWLKAHPEVMEINTKEYIKLVHKAGGCVVQAHPFRQEEYITAIRLLPNEIDGVEIYNACNRQPEYNNRALWYAQQFNNTQTAGTDLHHDWQEKFGGVLFNEKLTCIEDYVQAVLNNKIDGLYRDDNE